MLKLFVQGLLDLLWPPRTTCLICEEALDRSDDSAVCRRCWAVMPFAPGVETCHLCSRPLTGGRGLCMDCTAGQPFGKVWALGLHQGALREAIHHLKFGGRQELGGALGRLLAPVITRPYDLVVPVPLHDSRQRERGFNQATLVAEGIASMHGLPVAEGLLVRIRRTGHQAKLERQARLRNLSGAFTVSGERPPLSGQRILLVDDVFTTGVTAATAATALREGGAGAVDVAVLAVSDKPVRLGYYGRRRENAPSG